MTRNASSPAGQVQRAPAVHVPDAPWDVVVVGSGATGGWAAKVLARRTARVLVLEAGPEVSRADLVVRPLRHPVERFVRRHLTRNQRVQSRHLGYAAHPPDLFVDDRDHPYTTPPDRPFTWIRGRQVGGRSLTWGGAALRLSDLELKAAGRDGFGADWPISHADLADAYATVERACGVHGSREGLVQLPDGEFLPAAPQTPAELAFKAAVEARWPGRRVIPARAVQIARPPASDPQSPLWLPMSTQATALGDALATGRVTLRSRAVVSHLELADDKAVGVHFLDAASGRPQEVRARAVVLCASTLESTRILLRSGLGTGSGCLGRHLMDHHACWLRARFPDPGRRPERPAWGGPDASIVPRFKNLGDLAAHDEPGDGYLRGFGLKLGIQRSPPGARPKGRGVLGTIQAQGEMLPRAENRVTLDPAATDAFGLPALHVDCAWSGNELRMAADMAATLRELVDAAGGEVVSGVHGGAPPGAFVHEVGTARMGSDPASSVLDPQNRLWDAPNVLVTDGACWPSCGWQNPTLTMMAVTVRACRLLADRLSR